ncbi:hypothetical protein GL263_23205 [Streptomyces durbertensis]|uniref:dTMP kinase n=1 Tax=Streptomyces durbertensis TaxID=2448886 RepID=A0ABR6EM67_9ACTN|nr:hypothetical protein [Streptomyces durbertensis]
MQVPRPPAAEEETTVLPQVPAEARADETAVLPRVPADEAETTALPQVAPEQSRPDARGSRNTTPAAAPDEAETRALPRVPEDNAAPDRTRELPQLDDSGRPRRPRPEWAEETPMDDLPTLADELLGPFEDADDVDDAGDAGKPGKPGSTGTADEESGRNRGKRR